MGSKFNEVLLGWLPHQVDQLQFKQCDRAVSLRGFLFNSSSKNLHDVTSNKLWSRKKLAIIKKRDQLAMLEVRLNYLSILSVKMITKFLSCEEVIKEYSAKKYSKRVLQRCPRQLINKNIFIFVDFVMFIVFVIFFKFAICCDFFCHSK
jgi:hypothetical protein